jgi:hypothetical protein
MNPPTHNHDGALGLGSGACGSGSTPAAPASAWGHEAAPQQPMLQQLRQPGPSLGLVEVPSLAAGFPRSPSAVVGCISCYEDCLRSTPSVWRIFGRQPAPRLGAFRPWCDGGRRARLTPAGASIEVLSFEHR